MKRDKTADENIYTDCVKIYFDFYEQTTGLKPLYDGRAGKAMKDLIKWMQGNLKEGWTVQDFFKTIFDFYKYWEPFYQQQLNVSQIRSNINNICINIKNANRNSDTSKPNKYRERKESIRRRAEEDGGEPGIQKFSGQK